MRMINSFGICALLAVLPAAGCVSGGGSPGDDAGDDAGDDGGGDDGGGDDGGGDDAPPSTLTAKEFLQQLITAECVKAFACEAEYPASEGVFADEWGDTQADCVVDDDDVIDGNAINAAVTAGRITFDKTEAQACLASPGFPASCVTFFVDYDWPDPCYDALVGNVADGSSCTTGWECGEDSDCLGGTCAPDPDAIIAAKPGR